MKPQVTVLIDAFNYGRFIEAAIESVVSQDFPEERLEIVVIDDGSTDDTAERVRRYAPRVQYFYKANGGQASAFNFGVGRARGEIIAFLDADDYFLPGKLRRIVEELERAPAAGMIHHRLREIDSVNGEVRDGAPVATSGAAARSREAMLCFQPTPTSSLAFRRSVLEKILPVPETVRIQADGYMQVLAAFLAPVLAIDECLAVYRVHGANLYFLSEAGKDTEKRKLRAATLGAIVDGLRDWFRSNGYDLREPAVRTTLSRWKTMQEREEFAVASPGRVRFFLHLLESYRNYLPLMTWQLLILNYGSAVGALFVGYDNFERLEARREELTGRIRSILGRIRGRG
jgi:glycosyltransferase involved in cell wall biosynthesis